MDLDNQNLFSGSVSAFQDIRLPEPAVLVGYSALIEAFGLKVPLPVMLSAIGQRHKIYQEGGWQFYTPRHQPSQSLEGHLTFALKYEGLDLLVLKRLFQVLEPEQISEMIAAKPTGGYMRRLWFLYEWLLERPLDLPDAKTGPYVDVLDVRQQWPGQGVTSTRHRIRNNLPGTPHFCPLVRRTALLDRFVDSKLQEKAQEIVGKISSSVLARTAAFLLLKDSRSSYAIEGERPPHDRIQRWGKAIGEAGRHDLEESELLRLQRMVIGDERFVRLGLRTEGGFVGEHEQDSRMPLPDHISARPEDLRDLMAGMVQFDHNYADQLDPVIAAAILAFGFVYAHPFEDGNGRIHRYLIHHCLAARGFNPPGIVFPVSAAILNRIDQYRIVLESYSQRLLPFIEWQPTDSMNVQVLNETADFYRYFDATAHAEFLYACVEQTIEVDLPKEAEFLERYDMFRMRVETFIEMPASTVDLLFNFLKQNQGQLSARARTREFSGLTDDETAELEQIYADVFNDGEGDE